jgi:hypothetical protein
MATILTDNFNSYTDGNLGGQGSWQAYLTNLRVQGTTVKEGAKAIDNGTSTDGVCHKGGTALTAGKITLYALMKDHASWTAGRRLEFRCIQGSDWGGSPFIDVAFFQDGYIKLWDGATSWVNIQTYNDDQWYCVEIEWRNTPDYKFRVRIDGGTWTNWYAGYGGNWTSGLNRVGIDMYCNLSYKQFLDYIAEEPISAGLPTRSHAFIIG